MKRENPRIISGGIAKDDRGSLSFVNEFKFRDAKRFYVVANSVKKPIRAFHGHMKEAKYAYVVSGSALLIVVSLDKAKSPSKNCKIYRYHLSSRKPEVVYIPPGHANGFKALETETKIIFFSTATLKDSKKDDYRYPYDYWGKEIWAVEKLVKSHEKTSQ